MILRLPCSSDEMLVEVGTLALSGGRMGARVELTFPPLLKRGVMFLSPAGWPDEPVGRPTMGTTEDPEQIVSVNAVKAIVDLDVDLSEWEVPHLSLETRDIARDAVSALTAWARVVHDQPWLGLCSHTPSRIGPFEKDFGARAGGNGRARPHGAGLPRPGPAPLREADGRLRATALTA